VISGVMDGGMEIASGNSWAFGVSAAAVETIEPERSPRPPTRPNTRPCRRSAPREHVSPSVGRGSKTSSSATGSSGPASGNRARRSMIAGDAMSTSLHPWRSPSPSTPSRGDAETPALTAPSNGDPVPAVDRREIVPGSGTSAHTWTLPGTSMPTRAAGVHLHPAPDVRNGGWLPSGTTGGHSGPCTQRGEQPAAGEFNG
jgi:hypothetical protein